MRHWLFAFLSAASLLLCAAVVVLWVRSERAGDLWEWSAADRPSRRCFQAQLRASRGEISIDYAELFFPTQKAFDLWMTNWKSQSGMAIKAGAVTFHHITQPARFAIGGSLGRFGFQYRTIQSTNTTVLLPAGRYPYTGVVPVTVSGTGRYLLLPFWAAAACTALAPILYAIGWMLRGRRNRSRDRCAGCGYNLTGNTSGVCPECGKATSAHRVEKTKRASRRHSRKPKPIAFGRKLFRTASALSFLLGTAALALCVDSHRATTVVPVPGIPGWRIVAQRGQIWSDDEPLWREMESLYFQRLRTFEWMSARQHAGLNQGHYRVQIEVARGKLAPEYLAAYAKAEQANEQHLRRVEAALLADQPKRSSMTTRRLPELWKIAALSAVLPLACLASLLFRRGKIPGRCFTCDYNLTGNTSGVCPECGAAVPKTLAQM
ncbi:MAG TPA: hypothetical protein VN541_06085 [Tepidisphaeraceae bacterium]|nr:hypothetical protein [Tepidisphaeraceae bacterium]